MSGCYPPRVAGRQQGTAESVEATADGALVAPIVPHAIGILSRKSRSARVQQALDGLQRQERLFSLCESKYSQAPVVVNEG